VIDAGIDIVELGPGDEYERTMAVVADNLARLTAV